MLNHLKEKNPQLAFYSVDSPEFTAYGRVIKTLDTAGILTAAERIGNPAEGSAYVASQPEFEALAIKEEIQNEFFGSLPAQLGYCWGHNNFMNAIEWHTCSEINIAVTPLVLILGHVWDVKNDPIFLPNLLKKLSAFDFISKRSSAEYAFPSRICIFILQLFFVFG